MNKIIEKFKNYFKTEDEIIILLDSAIENEDIIEFKKNISNIDINVFFSVSNIRKILKTQNENFIKSIFNDKKINKELTQYKKQDIAENIFKMAVKEGNLWLVDFGLNLCNETDGYLFKGKTGIENVFKLTVEDGLGDKGLNVIKHLFKKEIVPDLNFDNMKNIRDLLWIGSKAGEKILDFLFEMSTLETQKKVTMYEKNEAIENLFIKMIRFSNQKINDTTSVKDKLIEMAIHFNIKLNKSIKDELITENAMDLLNFFNKKSLEEKLQNNIASIENKNSLTNKI